MATGIVAIVVQATLETQRAMVSSCLIALLTTTIVRSIGFSVFLFPPIGPALVTLATRGRQAAGVLPLR